MEELLNRLSQILDIKPQGAVTPIPVPLLLNATIRAGLSGTRLSQRVLERENEIFGYDEPHKKMLSIICEELVKEIQENAVIEIAVAPSSSVVVASGANLGGPVVVTGTITNIVKGVGVVR